MGYYRGGGGGGGGVVTWTECCLIRQVQGFNWMACVDRLLAHRKLLKRKRIKQFQVDSIRAWNNKPLVIKPYIINPFLHSITLCNEEVENPTAEVRYLFPHTWGGSLSKDEVNLRSTTAMETITTYA